MSEVFQLQREMGCTRAEFMACLPGATRQAHFEIRGEVVTVASHGGHVEISLVQKPPRRLAQIELPVLDVTFRFRALDESARDDFLAHFDLYTRRGGG